MPPPYRLIGAIVIIWAIIILYGLWFPNVSLRTTGSAAEVHQTRGLATQETPEERNLRLSMDKLSHEKPLTLLTILQAGVTFNGEIPLWGLISAVILALIAFVRLETKMSSHQETDSKNFEAIDGRFGSVDEMLTEIRGDVKRLLSEHRRL